MKTRKTGDVSTSGESRTIFRSFDPQDLNGNAETFHPFGAATSVEVILTRICQIAFVALLSILIYHLFPINWLTYFHLSDGIFRVRYRYQSPIAFSVSVLIIVVVAAGCWRLGLRLKLHEPQAQIPSAGNPYQRIISSLEFAFEEFSTSTIDRAQNYVRNPTLFTDRIGHTVTIGGNVFQHNISKRVQRTNVGKWKYSRISKNHQDLAIVHHVKKGERLIGLTIEVNGVSKSALPYYASKSLALLILTSIYYQIKGSSVSFGHDNTWDSVLTAVNSDHPVALGNLDEEGSLHSYLAILKEDLLSTTDVSENELTQFIDLVYDFTQSFLIWTVLPARTDSFDRVSLSFKQLFPEQGSQFGERNRIRLGLRPRKMYLKLPLALETPSYHQDLVVPEGMYLYDSKTLLIRERTDRKAMICKMEDVETIDQHLNPALDCAGHGSQFAHIYGRGVRSLRDNTAPDGMTLVPAVRIEFRERPPGNLLLVFLLSIFVLSLVWISAVYSDWIFDPEGRSLPAWATVVFTAPTIVSAWVLSKFPGEVIGRASFVTLAMIFWSLTNVVVVILSSALIFSGVWVLGGAADDPRINADYVWIALMLSTVSCSLSIFIMLRARSAAYLSRVRRS